MPEEAAAELTRLAQVITRARSPLHQQDAPTVTDTEYDVLRQRNAAIEARFSEFVRGDSPSARVGAVPTGRFPSSVPRVPMLSLENAFTDEDVRDFLERIDRFLGRPGDQPPLLTAEPKIDGLSMTLATRPARFVVGATRGDGVTGEDVTANVRAVKDIRRSSPRGRRDVFEVRGEIYFEKQGLPAP